MHTIERGSTNVGFGEYIKTLRKSKGMTQSELAEASGISSSNLWYIERGITKNPYTDTTEKLLRALGVDNVSSTVQSIKDNQYTGYKKSKQEEIEVASPSLPANTPDAVKSDPEELMQVLLTLITTNIKTNNENGVQEVKDYTEFIYKKMEQIIAEEEKEKYQLSITRGGEKFTVDIEEVSNKYDIDPRKVSFALRSKKLPNLTEDEDTLYIKLLGSIWVLEKDGNTIHFKDKLQVV